ncbi:MAG TPA: xanthine dehydrogenase family protein subunit M [Burkholderiales bacterium]|jgi:carbon-monoxide dehydrogenase medium subunit|nr:xanthine dehydrogenase family protein subunit M [Burkholderiales bacterium]
MAPFELAEPRSLSEAFSLLQDDGARPMSGGTALMLMMKAGVLRPTRLVSLRRLGLDRIERGAGGELRVGAMVTLRALEKAPELKDWPVIRRTLGTLANVRVRNVATVGGALSHGDPHMDLPPLLCALGASVTIAGPKGERTAPVEALYAGYLETTLKRAELISHIHVPPLDGRRAAYLKCTTRSADDWPALGLAVVLDAEKREASVVVSAATDRPTRLAAVERLLRGKEISESVLRQAAEAAREVPIEGDLHGSAAYKKHLIGVYLKRALDEARNASH